MFKENEYLCSGFVPKKGQWEPEQALTPRIINNLKYGLMNVCSDPYPLRKGA